MFATSLHVHRRDESRADNRIFDEVVAGVVVEIGPRIGQGLCPIKKIEFSNRKLLIGRGSRGLVLRGHGCPTVLGNSTESAGIELIAIFCQEHGVNAGRIEKNLPD